MSAPKLIICTLFVAITGTVSAQPQANMQQLIGEFSSGDKAKVFQEWQPYTFDRVKKHTIYSLVADQNISVIRASSESGASGLIKPVSIDITAYPIMTWRWKVTERPAAHSDERRSDDDHAARIYLIFNTPEPNESRWSWLWRQFSANKAQKTHAINYIWANNSEVASIKPNPYTASVMMISVNTGSDDMGKWVEHRRNLLEDYRATFNQSAPPISAIAIMTDSDNTESKAIAFYGDISFSPIDENE